MKKNLALLIFIVLIQVNCFSQLTVTTNSVANALAQTIAGNGVTVSNATINCNGSASGTFSYSGSNLGLTNGIILSTGLASGAVYTATNTGDPSTSFGTTYTDPNLTAIASGAINDVCLIAFDFVPVCSNLSITFVFASSEYDGFVCSFNDAFGIFLTGPNPAGGNYSAHNIATLPNGTPVSINNVNDGNASNPSCPATNSNYFVDNLVTPNHQIAYPGYTVPITSVTNVTPCTTYHMEIAIADSQDWSYDSSVFIQGNSVSCTNTPSVTTSVTGVNCGSLGSATTTVTNYTGTPTYQWLPGGATTSSISNLTPGTYTCLVGLNSGCGTTTQTVTAIVGASGATFNYTPILHNPSCNNGTNGSAAISVTGGTAPYTYTWSTTPVQNTATATNLPAGTYSVNVQDNIGCIGSTTVTLTNPASIIANVTTTPTTCSATIGSATANVTSGGTAPYTYSWTTGGQTQTINNLSLGTYSVTVTDVNTCTATAMGTVGGQGFSWSVSAASTSPLCAGLANGTATATISNPGTDTFTYSWTPTAQTNSVATGFSAGTYTIYVTDNNGCTSQATTALTDPPAITGTVNTTPTICSGSVGSATASILSGGTAPYLYTWLMNPIQSGASISNLAQGTYSVLVTDANNCSTISTGTVQSTGFTWVPVISTTPTKCYGSADGSATVSITNPGNSIFSPTSYTWVPSAQTNSVATGLSYGSYTVTVVDNNDCISVLTTTVTQPTQVVASVQTTPALCTSANGTAHATVFGGAGAYTYTWSSANSTQNLQTTTGLVQGPYIVTVMDVNGCTTSSSGIVLDTTDLTVTASQSPDLCSKGVGKAIANPVGQSPYTYTWTTNPAQNTQIADSLVVGTYSVNVIDNNGCTASASVTVVNHDDVLASQFMIAPEGEIYAENPVVLTVSNNVGWGVDTAFLSGVALTNQIPLNAPSFGYVFPQYGNYTASYYYSSIHGCKDTVTYDIVVKDYITLYIPNTFTPNGDGKNDVFSAAGTFVNTFEMYIYDRWGVLVTKLDNINKVWDGSENGGAAPQDTYVYKGSASDVFGKHITFQGQVNLIR
jgi:gliding motility-associated-like protein